MLFLRPLTGMQERRGDGRRVMDLSTETVARYDNGGSVLVYNAIDRTSADFQRICAAPTSSPGRAGGWCSHRRWTFLTRTRRTTGSTVRCGAPHITANAPTCAWTASGTSMRGLYMTTRSRISAICFIADCPNPTVSSLKSAGCQNVLLESLFETD